MGNRAVEDATTSICGGLTDLGCVYDCEFDNRGGNRSNYVFVRKPVAAKIRISDHPSKRMDKSVGRSKVTVIDVNAGDRKFGISWQEALMQISGMLAQVPETAENRDLPGKTGIFWDLARLQPSHAHTVHAPPPLARAWTREKSLANGRQNRRPDSLYSWSVLCARHVCG